MIWHLDPNVHKLISEDERELAMAAFMMAHPESECSPEIRTGPWSVVCICERCSVLRTYEIVGDVRKCGE